MPISINDREPPTPDAVRLFAAMLRACRSAQWWLSYCDMADTAQFQRLTDVLAEGDAAALDRASA